MNCEGGIEVQTGRHHPLRTGIKNAIDQTAFWSENKEESTMMFEMLVKRIKRTGRSY